MNPWCPVENHMVAGEYLFPAEEPEDVQFDEEEVSAYGW